MIPREALDIMYEKVSFIKKIVSVPTQNGFTYINKEGDAIKENKIPLHSVFVATCELFEGIVGQEKAVIHALMEKKAEEYLNQFTLHPESELSQLIERNSNIEVTSIHSKLEDIFYVLESSYNADENTYVLMNNSTYSKIARQFFSDSHINNLQINNFLTDNQILVIDVSSFKYITVSSEYQYTSNIELNTVEFGRFERLENMLGKNFIISITLTD